VDRLQQIILVVKGIHFQFFIKDKTQNFIL